MSDTNNAISYLVIPYPDLERMATQGMGETLLALNQAPATPPTRFYDTPVAYESASNPCHVLLWLIPSPDATQEPVTVHINRQPVCTMRMGECASLFLPTWTLSLGLEVGGQLTEGVEPMTYLADNLPMPESGVDQAVIRALEATRPVRAAIEPATILGGKA